MSPLASHGVFEVKPRIKVESKNIAENSSCGPSNLHLYMLPL